MVCSKWANYIGKENGRIGGSVVFYILSKEKKTTYPEKLEMASKKKQKKQTIGQVLEKSYVSV